MGVTNKDIVSTAKQYLGKLKYIFGSDNINGGSGDCSSFTEHVFAVHGIDIGADTNAQYQQGYAVNKSEILAGDLIFFKDTYNSGHLDGVSHVGISLGGSDFIHLSSSGGCKISSLDSDYYAEHYLSAKRIPSVSYENVEHSDVLDRLNNVKNTSTTSTDVNFVWWGDIVKVVVIVLVIGGGIAFLSMSLLGSVKVPKLNGKNILKGEENNE